MDLLTGRESGEVSGELAQTLGSGAAGAALGATYGDTPEEHIGGAVAGFGAGAAGASALQRFMRNRPKPPTPEFYHEKPLPPSGKPIAPITHAGLPTGRYVVENQNQIFEFEPSNALPRRQTMPKAQADDLGLDNFPEESRDALRAVLDDFAPEEVAAQRGGRQPMAHTEALARRMKLDAEQALAPGRNLSRAGHMAYAKAFEATAMEARELALKGRTGDGLNEREQARLLMLDQANRALGMSYLGLRSEAGGALNVYRHLKRLMPGEVRLVTEMVERGRLHKNMADLQSLYADLPNDPVKAFEKLREIEATRRSTSNKIADYYTANILSGFKTQLRNLFGNAARLASRLPAKASAGAVDAFLSRGGRPREVYAREVQHEIQGGIASLDRAFRDGIETFKLGFSREGLNEGLEDMTSLHIPRPEFEMFGVKGLKNPLNWPGRVMGGVDRFFRQVNMSMELYGETYARARREAEGKGLDGAAFTDYVSSRIGDMRMNPDQALKRRVAKAAERAVYQDDPGPAINALSSFVRHVPGARFVVPFIGTVQSILKQGAIDFGPAGFATKRSGIIPRKLKPGETAPELRDMMLARGEAAMGTLALAPIAMLAATGRLSGAGPTDPAKREALYESGWRPHSVRVPGGVLGDALGGLLGASKSDDGDWWVNYTLAQPIAVQAALVANGYEAWNESDDDNVITSTIMRAAQSAFDQSFLSGVGDLIDAINDPSQGQKYFGRLAQGFIPMSGLYGDRKSVV